MDLVPEMLLILKKTLYIRGQVYKKCPMTACGQSVAETCFSHRLTPIIIEAAFRPSGQ